MRGFETIAPYLTHPLVLTGFALVLLFGFFRGVLKAGIIPQVTKRAGSDIVQTMIRYGFILALALILLGFGLQFFSEYTESERAEHRTELAEEAKKKAMALAYDALQISQILAKGGDVPQETLQQISEAVDALAAQRGPEIEEALEELIKGDTSRAKEIFRDVIDARSGDIQEVAKAWRHLGTLAFLDDTGEALYAFRRATALDPNDTAAWNQLGHLLDRQGDLDEAAEAYQEVVRLGKAKSDKRWIAFGTGNLGILYEKRGELNEAEAMHRKALAILEELGDKQGIATAQSELGGLYETRGELDEAEAMYRKALAIFEEVGYKRGVAAAYVNLGNLNKEREELNEAEAMYRKALATFEELGRKEGMATTYGNIGTLYLMRGELDESEAMYRKALALDEELGRKEGMARNYANIGRLYETRGELDEARAAWRVSLTLYQEVGSPHAQTVLDWLTELDVDGIAENN